MKACNRKLNALWFMQLAYFSANRNIQLVHQLVQRSNI